MPEKKAFCIDLFWNGKPVPEKQIEIFELGGTELEKEMRGQDATTVAEMSDYNRMWFEEEEQAEEFLVRYLNAVVTLREDPVAFCASRDLAGMAYRRHMLAMLLMGEKMQTYRDYDNGWKVGQLFNLHDRTHFVTVRLTGKYRHGDEYEYQFEMAKFA